jgi:hypothetical protein
MSDDCHLESSSLNRLAIRQPSCSVLFRWDKSASGDLGGGCMIARLVQRPAIATVIDIEPGGSVPGCEASVFIAGGTIRSIAGLRQPYLPCMPARRALVLCLRQWRLVFLRAGLDPFPSPEKIIFAGAFRASFVNDHLLHGHLIGSGRVKCYPPVGRKRVRENVKASHPPLCMPA